MTYFAIKTDLIVFYCEHQYSTGAWLQRIIRVNGAPEICNGMIFAFNRSESYFVHARGLRERARTTTLVSLPERNYTRGLDVCNFD